MPLKGCLRATLYTTVEPCVLCAYVIRRTRILRVVFGVRAGALGGMTGPYPLLNDAMLAPDQALASVEGGVLAEECRQVVNDRIGRGGRDTPGSGRRG